MGNQKSYLRIKHRLGRLIDGAGPGPVARHDGGEHRGAVEVLVGWNAEGRGDLEFCKSINKGEECCFTIRQERIRLFCCFYSIPLSNLGGTLM